MHSHGVGSWTFQLGFVVALLQHRSDGCSVEINPGYLSLDAERRSSLPLAVWGVVSIGKRHRALLLTVCSPNAMELTFQSVSSVCS